MYYYRYLGLKIESDFPMKQLLPEDSDAAVDVVFIKDETVRDRVADAISDCKYSYIINQKHSYFRNSSLDFEAIEGKLVRYMPSEHERSKYTLNCLTGWASSIILLQRGILAMHASVVEKEGKAYLISGVSGSGKSTVTSSLLENGCRLLADDMTSVHLSSDGTIVLAEPAFPYQKLCRDAAMASGNDMEDMIYIDEDKDKFFVPMFDRFVDHATPVAGMFYINIDPSLPPSEVSSFPIQGLDKMLCVSFNMFLRPLLMEDRHRPEIGSLALSLAGKMPIQCIARSNQGNSCEKVLSSVTQFMQEH